MCAAASSSPIAGRASASTTLSVVRAGRSPAARRALDAFAEDDEIPIGKSPGQLCERGDQQIEAFLAIQPPDADDAPASVASGAIWLAW